MRSGQRDRALPVLTRHCHEFVHYHRFAGTKFGLVFRRLLAARTRLREQILLQLDPKELRALLGSETRNGPLFRIETEDRILVHPIVRANAESHLVATLCWLDAFESYLLDGRYAELFTSVARTAAVLDATAEWTRWEGRFAPGDLLAKLEAEPDAVPPPVPRLFPVEPICEAQATINERAMLALQADDSLAESMRTWIGGVYWDVVKRFCVGDPRTSEDFAVLASIVLLVTDIALNRVPAGPQGGPGSCLAMHPGLVVAALGEMQDSWRHVDDTPLQQWTASDFLRRRAEIVSLGLGGGRVPRFGVPGPDAATAHRRDAHPAIQQLGIFSGFRSQIDYVRQADPCKAAFPTGCILERPDDFVSDGQLLENLVCPFLAVGGVAFRNKIDEETWLRWRLLGGYELWLDDVFCGWEDDWTRLAADAALVELIRCLGLHRVVRAE